MTKLTEREIKLVLINSELINQDGWICTGTESSDFNSEFEVAINNLLNLFQQSLKDYSQEIEGVVGFNPIQRQEKLEIDKKWGIK